MGTKTIIKTSIQRNENIEVDVSVADIHLKLEQKGSYILVNRIHAGKTLPYSIRKTSIKLIKTQ